MLIDFPQLFARHHIKADSALHLGANTGQEAEVYSRLGIKRVIWVEALPDIHQQLCENIKRFPGQAAVLACIGDRDGDKVTFHRASNGSQSSSFLEFGTHAKSYPDTVFTETIEMETVRVDSLMNAWFPDHLMMGRWFLNIDLQGAELLALRGMGNLLWHIEHVYTEVNTEEVYKGCPLVGEIDDYLRAFGFHPRETKMMGNAGWGDKLYSRL